MQDSSLNKFITEAAHSVAKGKTTGTDTKETKKPVNPRDYHAAGTFADREIRLDIRDKNDTDYVIPYSQILMAVHRGQRVLTLYCSAFNITIKGRNLKALKKILQDERVCYLQLYNSRQFDRPDPDEPVITHIEISYRTEEPAEEPVQEAEKEEVLEPVN